MQREYRGLFIVLEGIDGSGKTTISKLLVDSLVKRGYRILYTYEPTDSEIVTIVKNKYKEYRDPYIDALTFALDRLLHLKTKIIPALREGYIVLSDRYFYSSVAYQSASGAPFEWVLEANRWALKPDLAVYLDIEPEESIKRRKGLESRFPEFEEVELLRKVREFYLEMVRLGLLVKVDASRTIEEVYNDVERLVYNVVNSRITALH